ncbi:hypothetical protein [Natronincola peptidivorans]|uniref:hypothetical protein n=1 Tax=Natronincola peptidivorans TaxID=426128 RepID=UPI0011134079|nr:hypothetical protein [Natronincola peptidivorans]
MGCRKAEEKLTEKASEKIVEGVTGSEVDIKDGTDLQNDDISGRREDTADPTGDVKIAVSPPAGWEATEAAGLSVFYSKDDASFIMKKEPYKGDTLEAVVQEAKGIFETSFKNVQYAGNVEDVIVDGRNAKQFIYTCDISAFSMKYQYLFCFVGGDVYVITCGSLEESFDNYAADFQHFIHSLHFE